MSAPFVMPRPGCVLREDPALAQQHRVCGAGRELLQMVGDQDRREFRMLPAQGAQGLDQLLAAREVEAGRRFVLRTAQDAAS